MFGRLPTSALLAAVLLAPSARAGDAPRLAEAPADALDVPRFLGLEVVAHRRSVDVHGRPISETTLRAGFPEVWGQVHAAFNKGKPLARGWTVQGAGKTEEKGTIAATLQGPDGLRYSLTGHPNPEGQMVLLVVGKARPAAQPRISEPVGDRDVR